ncbi:hypothetical protein Acr_00g0073700 [Actinidia rufa]|uniref:Uncharacterized protein n=1 Tax=Actinidia rufa TaxID=165716 RepID=A0A7J0DS66_9ERIC|nr:hypothetical protein Acr_00g0073700 [Actinidia rufa]
MELNRAQQLVHDNAALAKFKRNHEIPNDVLINRPGQHKVATTIRGMNDGIPIHTWLIHQARLRFPVSPILYEVMAHGGLTFIQVTMYFVRTMLVVDNLIR